MSHPDKEKDGAYDKRQALRHNRESTIALSDALAKVTSGKSFQCASEKFTALRRESTFELTLAVMKM